MRAILCTLFLAASLTLGAACGDDGGSAMDIDAAPYPMVDANEEPDCYENPTTHNEIINACTDPSVVRIEKNPVLPLLNDDGSLPPLP